MYTGLYIGAYNTTEAISCICMPGGSAQEEADITDTLPPPPHQVKEDPMDPDDLIGAESRTGSPVDPAILDSSLDSHGSRGVDGISVDFSTLTVSHVTNGTLSIGGIRKPCDGKHPPKQEV